MTTLILSLADPAATLETVGGKGVSLARLRSAGLPVPGGFHVTTTAYRRFVADNGLQYWLEKPEVEQLVAALERGGPLPEVDARIPARKEQWQHFLTISPPVMPPEKSGWSRLFHGGEAEKKGGKVVLKGVGTSGGHVTAPARVLLGPEDFARLKPGDVLVEV
jgi:phosphoenolpyruvate synthase/pyruvate phosphate dikinase